MELVNINNDNNTNNYYIIIICFTEKLRSCDFFLPFSHCRKTEFIHNVMYYLPAQNPDLPSVENGINCTKSFCRSQGTVMVSHSEVMNNYIFSFFFLLFFRLVHTITRDSQLKSSLLKCFVTNQSWWLCSFTAICLRGEQLVIF